MSISISSGSVLSSLYKNQKGESSFYTGIYAKKSVVENESVTKSMSVDSDFKKALKKLKFSDYNVGLRHDIKKSAKSLVKSFNDFKDSVGDGSKQFERLTKDMKKVFEEHSSDLLKAGISFEEDKLKFDEEKFNTATNDELKKIFGADSKFIASTEKLINKADRIIKNKQFSEVKEDAFVSNKISKNNIIYAAHTNALAVMSEKLNATKLDATNDEAVASMINEYTNQMVEFYSDLSDQDKWQDVETSDKASSKLQKMIALNEGYIDAINKSSQGEAFDFDRWFSEDEGSYGKQISGIYKDLFSEFVNASKKDFEISNFVDYSI